MAKHIEDEIQSACAFVEKKYYSGDYENVFGTPKEGPSHLIRSTGSNCSTATVHLVDHSDIAELLTRKTSLPVNHPIHE